MTLSHAVVRRKDENELSACPPPSPSRGAVTRLACSRTRPRPRIVSQTILQKASRYAAMPLCYVW